MPETKITTHDADEDLRNMDIKIYVNGEIVHRDDAKVPVYDSGFMLGDGMWEGMRLYNGKWSFFDEHMDRFFGSCKAVSLDVGMDRDGILDALNKTAKANGMNTMSSATARSARAITDTAPRRVSMSIMSPGCTPILRKVRGCSEALACGSTASSTMVRRVMEPVCQCSN